METQRTIPPATRTFERRTSATVRERSSRRQSKSRDGIARHRPARDGRARSEPRDRRGGSRPRHLLGTHPASATRATNRQRPSRSPGLATRGTATSAVLPGYGTARPHRRCRALRSLVPTRRCASRRHRRRCGERRKLKAGVDGTGSYQTLSDPPPTISPVPVYDATPRITQRSSGLGPSLGPGCALRGTPPADRMPRVAGAGLDERELSPGGRAEPAELPAPPFGAANVAGSCGPPPGRRSWR
jgi:hypothetical protein